MQVTASQPAVPLVGWQSWWAWLVVCGSVCWGHEKGCFARGFRRRRRERDRALL